MKVLIKNTRQDYIHGVTYFLENEIPTFNSLKKTKTIFKKLILCTSIALYVLIRADLYLRQYPINIIIDSTVLILYISFIIFILRLFEKSYTNYIDKEIDNIGAHSYKSGKYSNKELDISNSRIKVCFSHGYFELNAENIIKTIEAKDRIYILNKYSKVLIIPLNSFQDNDTKLEFIKLLNKIKEA